MNFDSKLKSMLFIFVFIIFPDIFIAGLGLECSDGMASVIVGGIGAVSGIVCMVLTAVYDVDILYYYKYLIPRTKNTITKTTIILSVLVLFFIQIFGATMLLSIFLADMTDRISHKIILVLTNPVMNFILIITAFIIDVVFLQKSYHFYKIL